MVYITFLWLTRHLTLHHLPVAGPAVPLLRGKQPAGQGERPAAHLPSGAGRGACRRAGRDRAAAQQAQWARICGHLRHTDALLCQGECVGMPGVTQGFICALAAAGSAGWSLQSSGYLMMWRVPTHRFRACISAQLAPECCLNGSICQKGSSAQFDELCAI